MHTIVNPITRQGKVKCIHHYELCLKRWYVHFIAIFVFNDHIWLYHVEDCNNPVRTLIDYGEMHPSNMEKALDNFKTLIY